MPRAGGDRVHVRTALPPRHEGRRPRQEGAQSPDRIQHLGPHAQPCAGSVRVGWCVLAGNPAADGGVAGEVGVHEGACGELDGHRRADACGPGGRDGGDAARGEAVHGFPPRPRHRSVRAQRPQGRRCQRQRADAPGRLRRRPRTGRRRALPQRRLRPGHGRVRRLARRGNRHGAGGAALRKGRGGPRKVGADEPATPCRGIRAALKRKKHPERYI
mmetsp:Transcript_10377/g.26334  ORF Transcript_10377/g.26334 Transcript_10377/m.26334 type:complete len:216 (+) Transcript_10377:601-1248(+)